jgi:endo-1,4-beta-xylanase
MLLLRTLRTLTAVCLFLACGGPDAPPLPTPPIFEPPPLRVPTTVELKDLSTFPVGMQAYVDILDAPVPRARIVSSFDRYTAAAFYWSGIESVNGTRSYALADKAVRFGELNALPVHGHPLVYFQQGASPEWLNQFSGTRAQFESVVKAHIEDLAARYRGRVAAWDVVNEMAGEVGGRTLYNAALERFYGSDAEYVVFIAQCFRWARAADPAAKLFYNEALLELPDRRRLSGILALIAALKAANAPIDGIGTQMHVDVYWPQAAIDSTLAQLAATGLLVHISELDVSVNSSYTAGATYAFTALTPDLAEQQRARYATIVASYLRNVPAAQRWGITVWDMLDHTSWLNQFRTEWPCLYDRNADKKPAFYGFAEGLL